MIMKTTPQTMNDGVLFFYMFIRIHVYKKTLEAKLFLPGKIILYPMLLQPLMIFI